MKPMRSVFAALFLAAGAGAHAALPLDTLLIEDGPAKVTVNDLNGYLLKMPATARGEALANYGYVASMVDAVFMNRVLANKAKAMGLDKDPSVQARLVQLQESFLAELYFQDLDKKAKFPNLEPRARELYKAEPARYTSAEHVNVQRIIVSFMKRTPEMALDRARKARAEAAAGGTKAAFLAAAAQYNDDPDKRRHAGDLGLMGSLSFATPVATAIAKMKAGEVSEPIEAEDGYHIIRLEARQPGELAPFASVATPLMEAEKEKILKDRRTAELNEVRASKTVVVHRANVESAVSPIDPAEVRRATGQSPQ